MFGTVLLGPESGLPALPDVEYVMRAPDGPMPEAVAASAAFMKTCAASGFASED